MKHRTRHGGRRAPVVVVGVGAFLAVAALSGCDLTLADASVSMPAQLKTDDELEAERVAKLPKRQVPLRTVTVLGSGDILIHPSLATQADKAGSPTDPNFAPMLSGIAPRVRAADFSICHVETPFSEPGVATGFPHYYVHPSIAKGIKATGFDECSTASNWTADKGIEGVRRTISALKANRIGQAGSQSASDESRIRIRKVKGIRVAHLSYTDPHDSPHIDGSPWAVNRQSPEEIASDAAEARQQGAEVVIVSLAMGSMGSDQSSKEQDQAADTITRGGDVNLVIGHGSHTVQPAQRINNTWVIWHGNLLASFFPNQTNMLRGLMSHTTLKEQADGRFTATKVIGYPIRAVAKSPRRVVDLAAMKCSVSPFQSDWSAIKGTETRATATGFLLARPCQGR